ncbi:HK97 gp10 family phage protein [Paenibacillus sp. FSL K6-1318]|uniref:HK97 gp10 family phage protein n=1 Tax=Paenibacillus sp. FSL K6-1318 TaxID=2975291 RepID=UPI0030EB40C5
MVSLDNLANEITSAVKTYTEDVTSGIEKELDKTSRKVTKDISANSPKKSGRYAAGWARKKVSDGSGLRYSVYNKNKPGLTHLLENGHAKRRGGRVAGKPHIRPAVDRELPDMVNRIKSIIRSGG